MDTTTIEISRENWRWLNSLKENPGDSFDDVITRLRGEETADTDHSLPDRLDLPGSDDTLNARREAIAQLYNYLQEEGTASRADFLELVDAESVGYQSAESFWSNCIKGRDSLSALPGVESPGEGEHTWRFVFE